MAGKISMATVKRIQSASYKRGYRSGFVQGRAYERARVKSNWKRHKDYVMVRR